MNDNAIKNYAIWARRELMGEVEKRCAWWGIAPKGAVVADADTVDGRVLSRQERAQRKELLRTMAEDGYAGLVERAAYTWFNRLLAIRFMEVNDRLPSHVRVLSAPDGSFVPQCLKEALDLPLDALDRQEAARLVQAGNDEDLFRIVFLAQCDELARCMPAVFDRVGSAMELLLPTGLLRPEGVVGRLVTDIPEDDWREGVEIVGWMYQYYVSERKDEVFKSFKKGKKAERDAIAPATQLFTPHWIVRYLTENSLGRLWMLNNPQSKLMEQMPYYVKPDEEHETEFRRISSPEEITVVDPACGSGHILVYAFELLLQMYRESGYRDRDAVKSIIQKNLTGLEIDRRAASMASFALTMKACEADGRFLRRGVTPRITVLERVEFTQEELDHLPHLTSNKALLDAVTHLDECGSLLRVTSADLEDIERDLASLASGASLFAGSAEAKLARLSAELAPLAARYDVVVANPPYMGSSSMGRWTAVWVKRNYKDESRDLCTCFIDRGFSLCNDSGTSAMVTMQSWMFLGSFERMRKGILEGHAILAMAHLGTRAFGAIGGEVVSTTATVFSNARQGVPGAYVRLVDYGSEAEKSERLLEALADPGCGWFYRRDASAFEAIPGSPIAYWASESTLLNFARGESIDDISDFTGSQHITANNDMYLRYWWEVSASTIGKERTWAPYSKGGNFRRWFGNLDMVVRMDKKSIDYYRNNPTSNCLSERYWYSEGVTYSDITSGRQHFRYFPPIGLFDKKGPVICSLGENLPVALALLNTSVAQKYFDFLNPTMTLQVKDVKSLPFINEAGNPFIARASLESVELSEEDWKNSETAFVFDRHSCVDENAKSIENDIKYIAKFVSNRNHGMQLINGSIRMMPAGYYASHEKDGVGDRREGGIFDSVVVAHDYPVFCCTAISSRNITRENRTDTVHLSPRLFDEFSGDNGYVVIIRFNSFENHLKSGSSDYHGHQIEGGIVNYRSLSVEESSTIISDRSLWYKALLFKDIAYSYQQEFRLISHKTVDINFEDDNPFDRPLICHIPCFVGEAWLIPCSACNKSFLDCSVELTEEYLIK